MRKREGRKSGESTLKVAKAKQEKKKNRHTYKSNGGL